MRELTALRRLIPLLDVRWWRVLRAIAVGALAIASSVALAATSAWLIARASQMPPVLALSVAVAGVRAFGVGKGILRYLERLASHDVALRGMTNLRTNLYERLATTPGLGLASYRRGDLLDRVGSDVDEVGNLVVRSLVPAGVAVLLALASVAFIWTILPPAALALLTALLLAGLLAPWLVYRSTAASEAALAAAHDDVAAQSLMIAEDGQQLRVAGTLDAHLAQLHSAEQRLEDASQRDANALAVASAIAVLAQALAVIAALWFGAAALQPGGALSGGEPDRVLLAVIVITPMAVFEATAGLPAAAVQLRRSQEAASRLTSLLTPPAVDWAGATTPISQPITAPAGLTTTDVAIGHPGGPVLASGIDLDLEPGQTLAVVGRSGVGKTTLLLTLTGLLPPQSGAVTRSGQALFVAEDDHIFGTTVLENLRVARGNVTESEAAEALAAAGLGRWLAALPDGLATMLGPNATNISGGERRRLLVARALLSPAQILTVDEPGEHLDPATADDVLAALIGHVRGTGRILIVATHRPVEAAQCDQVLNLAASTDLWDRADLQLGRRL